jgi:hypothetical protein
MILYGARGSWHNSCSTDEIAMIKRSVQDKAGRQIMQHLINGNGIHIVKVQMSERKDSVVLDTWQYYITATIEDYEYDY